ncbi:MAG: DUF4386 domain-containing protein [Anaerolineae bacterium]|nr:DUF4386 domain-containing protein [Anaerolineae bacterium]
MTLYRVTGLGLILLPIAFNIIFFALGRAFDYPTILRQPTDVIFKRFTAGGPRLVALWYAFALTAVVAIPLALLFQLVFVPQHPSLAAMSAIVGALSGLVQAMGLLRWSLLVPTLAAQYHDAAATPEQRSATAVVFQAFHLYIGVVVGEHLGYLFNGTWTILISVMMFTSPLFSPVLGVVGIVSALGILAGLLEPAGWKPAGAINAMSYILWSLWLIVSGVTLLFR